MARKKRSGRKATTRRRSGKPARRSSRRRGRVRMAGFGGAIQETLAGIAGAVLVSKAADMIPIGDAKTKRLLITGAGIYLMAKGTGTMRNVGTGVAIAGGTMVLNTYFPNLLGTGTPTVGRLSPETTARIQRAADEIRGRIGGLRGRVITGNGGIMGSGGDMDFPQPVGGPRGRVITGSGDASLIY